jgi:hypothetical protein
MRAHFNLFLVLVSTIIGFQKYLLKPDFNPVVISYVVFKVDLFLEKLNYLQFIQIRRRFSLEKNHLFKT